MVHTLVPDLEDLVVAHSRASMANGSLKDLIFLRATVPNVPRGQASHLRAFLPSTEEEEGDGTACSDSLSQSVHFGPKRLSVACRETDCERKASVVVEQAIQRWGYLMQREPGHHLSRWQ